VPTDPQQLISSHQLLPYDPSGAFSMTDMNSQSNELFGIRRSTILIISFALAIGSFSAWKAVGGGSATAARISVSGTALAAGGDKSPSVVAGLQTKPHSSTVRSPAAHTTASLGSAILTKADADAAHHPTSVMAGLPTEPPRAVRTALTPIEQIQVGDRVLAESPTGEEDTTFGSEIIPADWRKLTLRAPKRDGTVANVVLLRPLTWLNEQRSGRSRLPSGTFAGRRTNARHLSNELGSDSGTTNALSGRDASRNPARQAGPTVESQTIEDMVGGTVFISVPECGIDGNAEVLAIDPCPEIHSGTGRVVTGTFCIQAQSTIELKVSGEPQPIGCTGNHPFWSEDRQEFVRADSLQPGEKLRTATGLATVESWSANLHPTLVYNFEVHGAHVYHVGMSGVLVHNDSGFATVWGSRGHLGIEVFDANGNIVRSHVTELTKGRYIVDDAHDWIYVDAHKFALQNVTIHLDDVGAAMSLQGNLLGKPFKYELGVTDCVSHVTDVLSAGGFVGNLPNTVDGFLNALRLLGGT
jgi:hypothetical protein